MAALPPGTSLFNGAYILEAPLGRGGFGLTYRAHEAEGERPVAIKECFPTGCVREGLNVESGDFASRECLESFRILFREQAARLKALHHPAIVPLHDCFDENGTTYLVMDLLEGPTLLQKLESEGAVPIETALEWGERLASALDAMHSAGFLHLDIKPENTILVDDEPVLVDFDLMTPRDSNDLRTRPLQLAAQIGTPGYAPLEQYAQHATLSPATDVYALGATLYHLISGNTPLSAVDRAAGVTLPPLQAANADLPPHLGVAIENAMHLQSGKRPQNIAEWLQSLQTPLEPEPDDEAPQNAAHSQGLYRVVLTVKTPVFPKRCVCCYAKSPTEEWTLSSPSGRWQLPLCELCRRHQAEARQSGFIIFWGMGASLLLAILGVWLSVLSNSFFPIFFCLLAPILCFTVMTYSGLKNSRAEEMLSDYCCDLNEPALYIFNGRVYIWKFRNSRYSEEFKEKNRDYVV
jgi:serine/threonine protein kinase